VFLVITSNFEPSQQLTAPVRLAGWFTLGFVMLAKFFRINNSVGRYSRFVDEFYENFVDLLMNFLPRKAKLVTIE